MDSDQPQESVPSMNITRYESIPLECEICQHLMRGFHTPFTERYHVELGTVETVLYKTCSAHGPLLVDLQKRFETGNDPILAGYERRLGRGLNPQEASVKIEKSRSHTNLDITIALDKIGGIVECLELVKGPSAEHVGRGTILDAKWIDSSLLNKWLDCCRGAHGDGCEHPLKQYRLSENTPGMLIDVRNRCLVPGKPEMKYVTLSYVWGQTERPRLEKKSLAHYQQPKALLDPEIRIPETVRNAMDIVELLGETYLWTDSLCIIEDDEVVKFAALHEMAAIYANSVLTIIAADGEDAEHGLRGIKGFSKSRELKSDRWKNFGDQERVMRPMFPWFHYSQTSYFKRGWTFQEYLFSKRRLIFQSDMVRWECSRSKWHEDIVHIDGPESQIEINWMEIINDRYPTLGAFGYMLLEQNHRRFTYQEDALPAITGLLSMLSQKYEGGFLCGIPEMYFEAGLNWTGWSQDVTRRLSSGLSSASKCLTVLPSWSWIGWEGRISGGLRSNQDYVKKGRYATALYTIPITEWYTSGSPSGLGKRHISSKFLRERDSLADHLSRPLPLGWTRHPQDPEKIPAKIETLNGGRTYDFPPPEGCGTCFYTHNSVPGIEFWYPIPILSPDTQPIIPPQTQYLFCETHRAFLHADAENPNSKEWDYHLWLRDEAGTWAGILLLHAADDKKTLKTETGVELVAISRGKIANDQEKGHAPIEIDYEERMRDGKWYEFYNVLWVEWKDGVAFRQGSGRVVKDIWEGLDLEGISLVLG